MADITKATAETLKEREARDRALRTFNPSFDRYRLLQDAYYGVGLFEHGAGLRRHPRESMENFRDRQALAYYWNYTGPIINAYVDPIYKDEIRREYKGSEMFDSFLNDCDRAGTAYQDFCKDAALAAKLYGVAYVVVDNSNVMADSLEDALSNRQLPFLKLVTPDMIKDWTIDVFGRLSSFSYTETIQTGRNRSEEITYIWTPDEWAISTNGNTISGAHNLGRVPVVQWRARNTKLTVIKPPSEFLSVAQANYFLFQLCSWHTQILRDQAFNILTMPDTGSTDITVGTNNVLTYPPESNHTPAFISPAAAPAEMLTSQMDRTIQEMFRMSGLNSVIGLQTDQSKSGVAKQWDFETTNRRLAGFSARCEKADAAIVALYELWSGDTIDYHCEYPKDFRINDVADSLAEAQTALELGFDTPTYKKEVLKKVLEAYMPNLEPETYDAIVNEVEDAANQAVRDNVYGAEGDEPVDAVDEGTEGSPTV